MRKLVFGINLTIDGCCDHTKGMGDEETHEYFANLLREADVLVYGRKTYQLMVPFWPDIARNNSATSKTVNAFARAFDAIDKIIVFSRTLGKLEDPRTSVVSTGLQEEILKLKQEEGKNILLGGVDLPSQLIALDLIDEYHFVVQPLIVGEGKRFLDGTHLPETRQLTLVESKVFTSGCVACRYVRKREQQ